MNNGFGRGQGKNFFLNRGGAHGGMRGNMHGGNVQQTGGRWQAGGVGGAPLLNRNQSNNNRQFGNKGFNNRNNMNQNSSAPKPGSNNNQSTVQARLGPATPKTAVTTPTGKLDVAPPPSRPVLMRVGPEKTPSKTEIKAPANNETANKASPSPAAPASAPKSVTLEKKELIVPPSAVAKLNKPPPSTQNNQQTATSETPATTGASEQNIQSSFSNSKLANRLGELPSGQQKESVAQDAMTGNGSTLEDSSENTSKTQSSYSDDAAANNQQYSQRNNYQNKQMNNNRGGGNNRQNYNAANRQQNNPNKQNQFRQNNNQNRPNNQYNRQNDKNAPGGGQRRSMGGGPNNYNQDKFWDRMHDLSGPQLDLEPLDMAEKKFNAQSRLFVGSLTRDMTQEEIKDMFSKYGDLGQVYYNKEGGYAFINFDYKNNAEKAVRELNNFTMKGRQIKVRFAAVTTGVKVRNLSPYVTNELLHKAFSVFGQVEISRVTVDDRGKPTGDGIVLFTDKKSAVMAFKKCQEHSYFLTSQLRPVIVEPWETKDDEEGYPEIGITRNEQYQNERKMGPRFAEPNSAESDYAKHWKQLFDIYKEKKQALENDLKAEMEALEVKMRLVAHQQETEMLRKALAQKEKEARQLEMGLGMYGEPQKPSTQFSDDISYSRVGGASSQISPGGVKRPHDYYDQHDSRQSDRFDRYGGYGGSGDQSSYYRGSTYDRMDERSGRGATNTNYPPPTGGYGTGYGTPSSTENSSTGGNKHQNPPPKTSQSGSTPTPPATGASTATGAASYDSQGYSATDSSHQQTPIDTGYGDHYGSYDSHYDGAPKRGRY